MPDNFKEHFYVDDDGEIVRGIERISEIPVTDIEGNPIGAVKVASCATYRDIHFRVMDLLWDYHRRRNYSVESVAKHLRATFPGFPKTVEAFLVSKKGEEHLQ